MLVEDHADFRDLMAILIGREPDLEVVAQAGSLAEARRLAATSEFDVVVMDLGLPDGDGTSLIGDLREARNGVGVVVMSAGLDPRNYERAVGAGANEVLDKVASATELVGAVRRLAV